MTAKGAPYYRRYRDRGVCPGCQAAPDGGHVYCAACRARMARLNRASRNPHRRDLRFAAEGRCRDCGLVKPDVAGAVPRCPACRDAYNQCQRARRLSRKRRAA